MQDDNKHRILRDILRGIPKVKATHSFEDRLMKRLRDVESLKYQSPSIIKLKGKERKFSFSAFLKPSLIPAIGLTVVLLIFIIYYINISLIQDKHLPTEVSQNIQKNNESSVEQKQNVDTGGLITKIEPSLGENSNYNENLREQSQPPSTIPSGYDKAPSIMAPEKKSDGREERISAPKLEEKKSDELKSEEQEMDGLRSLDKKEEVPMMKKSGEIKHKDTEKQDMDEKNMEQKVEGKDINAPMNQYQDTSGKGPSKADSIKSKSRNSKRVKKDDNYNDTLKAPIKEQNEQEDSTKNQQK